MKNTKLSELLYCLSKEESRKFHDFLKSPYFNKSKQVLRLHLVLKKQMGRKNEPGKKVIYEKVFPGEKFNDQKLRSLVSDLMKLLYKFLVTQYTSKYIDPRVILMNEFNDRVSFKNLDSVCNSLARETAGVSAPNDKDYLTMLQLFDNLTAKCDTLFLTEKTSHIDSQLLYTEFYSAFLLLRNLNNRLQLNIPVEGTFEENNGIIEWIERLISKNLKLIQQRHKMLYMEYLTYKMFLPPGRIVSYEALKKEFKVSYKVFNIETQNYIYNSLSSFAINERYHNPSFNWKTERIQIIKFFEKIGYFNNIDHIEGPNLYNIINSAIDNDKPEFADYFLNKYEHKVNNNIRQDIVNLSRAIIMISRKKYNEALYYISLVTNKHPHIYLNSKLFQSTIYFENGELEPLLYIMDAAKHYLMRNKNKIGLRYNIFYNFYKYLNIIIKKKDTPDPLFFKKLHERISVENPAEKYWLLKIVSKLSLPNRQ
jgi:hypothetical protein